MPDEIFLRSRLRVRPGFAIGCSYFFFAAMGLALVFLLFSMRKHTRRVTFNDAGLSDAERMGRLDDGDPRDDSG